MGMSRELKSKDSPIVLLTIKSRFSLQSNREGAVIYARGKERGGGIPVQLKSGQTKQTASDSLPKT